MSKPYDPEGEFEAAAAADDDRPSLARVESFLAAVEGKRAAARRTRLVALGVVAAVSGVAFLTAIGVVPVEAENVVVSASAVVAGLAMGKD
jgi:hypothetical protein